MSTGRIEARYRLDRPNFTLDVKLDLPAAGITGLFGVSGSGKTTLLRCMAGLERSSPARLVIDGDTVDDGDAGLTTPVHRRRIAVVFQEPRLFTNLDVRGNVLFGAKRARGRADATGFDETVALLGLEGLLDRNPATLSGGEAQRVAIARALLFGPRLVLMDEPLSSLDPARREEVLPYLESLHAKLAVPLVYISHQQDEILRLADTLVVMDAGRVAAQGDMAELLAGPQVAGVPGDMTAAILDGTVRATDQEFALTEVLTAAGPFWVTSTYPPGTLLRLVVKASDVSVAKSMPEGSSIQNHLAATIVRIDDDSNATALLVLAAGTTTLLARVTRRAVAELSLAPGSGVFALVKTVAVRRVAASG